VVRRYFRCLEKPVFHTKAPRCKRWRNYKKTFIFINSKIKIPAPRDGVLNFTATDSVAEEKTNAASCGVLNPKIKIKKLLPNSASSVSPWLNKNEPLKQPELTNAPISP
jgi:hypothetical protein